MAAFSSKAVEVKKPYIGNGAALAAPFLFYYCILFATILFSSSQSSANMALSLIDV